MAKDIKSFLTKKYPNAINVDILTEVQFVNTGIPTINYLLSGKPKTGGIPLSGKMICLYGPEGASKTSLVLQLISEIQKQKIETVFLDTERSMTKPRIKQFNVDLDNMIYAAPDTMEECFSIIEDIYKAKLDANTLEEPIIIIWDSIAATPTNDEVSRSAEQIEIAAQSKVLTRNLRRIRTKVKKMNAGIIFINQARANQDRYGDIFNMPGGYALHHTADIIVRINKIKPDEKGQGVKLSTPTKNRLFRPFQNTVIQFDYSLGFTEENILESFCEFLVTTEILCQAGAWCYLNSDVKDVMRDNPDMKEKDAIKEVKKFYKKDFAKRLLEDKDYYEKILLESEEFVNKNISKVTKLMLDDEISEETIKAASEEGIEVPYDPDGLEKVD
ncbi:MAG: ATPase domain-containing protein [Candidatus Nanoarchaeia archaeon]|nr:ATPase domain-containing protein [Candidatus Nanoarchaeia archaeon]